MNTKTLVIASFFATSASLMAQNVFSVDFESPDYSTGTNVNLAVTNPSDWASDNTNGARNTNIQDQSFDTILSGQYLDFDQNTAAGGSLQLLSAETANDAGNSFFQLQFDLHDRVGDTNVTTISVSMWGTSGNSSRNLLILDDGVASNNGGAITQTYSEGSDLTFTLLVNGGDTAAGGLSANSYSLFIDGASTNISNVGLGGDGTFIDNFRSFTISGDNSAVGLDGMYFDNISVVPEPSSYALLAGVFSLGWIMVRRRS